MRFQIGDIVRISKDFGGCKSSSRYPRDRDGRIIRITENRLAGSLPIKVRFDDVEYNSNTECSMFRESEVKLVRRR